MKRRAYQIHLDYSMQSLTTQSQHGPKTTRQNVWGYTMEGGSFFVVRAHTFERTNTPLKALKVPSRRGVSTRPYLSCVYYHSTDMYQETCIKTLNVWMQNWKRAQVQEPGTGRNNQTCQARKQTAPHASYWLNYLDPVLLSVNAAERILWLSSPGERHKLPVFSWSHHAMHKMMPDLTASFELVIPLGMKMFSIKTWWPQIINHIGIIWERFSESSFLRHYKFGFKVKQCRCLRNEISVAVNTTGFMHLL